MPPVRNTILAFDCSTGPCSVALWQSGNILFYKKEEATSKQAAMLIPMIEEGLKQQALWYSDLAGIATTIGPGSFTGIRIGLAAAKGLAMAASLPVAGITTLQTVAYAARQKSSEAKAIIAVLNAGKGQIYRQTFDAALAPLHDPDMVDYADILSGLPAQPYLLAGNGSSLISPSSLYIVCDEITHPDARSIAAIAASAPQRFTDYRHISPLYIRPPDAKPMANVVET